MLIIPIARVTVHFTAVTERFSPHDTVFPITTAKELRDTTLSSACSLHTASGSTSSSTSSLRRRRLMEIAEDEEEEVRAKRQSTVPEERPSTAKTMSVSGAPPTVDLPELPLGITPSISYQSSSDSDGFPPPREVPPSPERFAETRRSSQSTRPELYSYSSYGSNGKPKVKLGPRPSLDVGGRPHTSGAASYYRPVSTLPAGLKLFSRSSSKKEKDRPQSSMPNDNPSMTLSPPPEPESSLAPAQDTLVRPHTSGGRPTTSSSIKPLGSPLTSSFPKTPTISREKARLLKAMELRERRMNATASPGPHSGDATSSAELADSEAIQITQEARSCADDGNKGDDSGIAFDASSAIKTDGSDATRSDSYPVSPVGPSEHAQSTRASSISGSTDETVHESHDHKLLEEPETSGGEAAVPSRPQDYDASIKTSQTNRESLQKLLPTLYDPFSESNSVVQVPPIVVGPEATQEKELPASPDSDLKDTSVSLLGNKPAASEAHIEEIQVGPDVPAEPVSPSKNWKIPRSKFSIQDLRAEAETPAIPTEPLPTVAKNPVEGPEPSPIGSTFSLDTKRSITDDDRGGRSLAKRKKRRGHVEPIRTDLDPKSANASEANFSSDDDLMDELQSAVFQDAKPISVSKSPMSPVFPSPQKKFSRAASQPSRKDISDSQMLEPKSAQPKAGPPRSVSASAAYLDRIAQQQAKPLPKKVNLGSGISQRIKALEKLSSLAPGDTPASPAPSNRPSSSFFSVRKESARSPSKTPSIADRANSLSRTTPSPSISRESSPETIKFTRERSGSVKSRLQALTSSAMPSRESRARPESISVTARIIRDPAQPFPAMSELGKKPADYAPLDLKQSPLVIDHQKAIPDPHKESIQERRLSSTSRSTTKERRSSVTVIKDLISDGRASFSERRRSINLDPSTMPPPTRASSRPPSVHKSPVHGRPASIGSRRNSRDLAAGFSPPATAGSNSSTSDEKSETKSTRASRMLRRLSSSLSAGRKTISHAMSPTVREEFEPSMNSDPQGSFQPPDMLVTPTTISMGDVNCQFPDSLLWKRRSMMVDSAGYLILSPALTASGKEKSAGGATRRFHMSEFRTPAIPDADMQELPNSVVLDFVEGAGLQVACEDRAGQGSILKSRLLAIELQHKYPNVI